MNGEITLVTGGCRSGKSDYALKVAMAYDHRVFVATAEACDEEMNRRIQRHRQERGDLFQTMEEPFDLGRCFAAATEQTQVVLIDCLPVWLGNLTFRERFSGPEESCPEIDAFLGALTDPPCDVVIVTGEIGLGVVPADPGTRLYRDRLGRLNRNVAELAAHMYFVVSGLPMKLK